MQKPLFHHYLGRRNCTECSFLGQENCGDFKNYVTKAESLTELTKASNTLEWNQRAQDAFDELKKELSSEPVLALPDKEGTFYLDTNASEVAIAGILHHEQEWNGHKVLQPTCYGSKLLNEAEHRNGASEHRSLDTGFEG